MCRVLSQNAVQKKKCGEGDEDQTDKYGLLCQQRGMDFVPIIFTTSGGMGEQFQRQYWNPRWIRVAAEDEAMKIRPRAAEKRKANVLGSQIRGRSCEL